MLEYLMGAVRAEFLGSSIWMWLVFLVVVITLLAFDLGILHKNNKEISIKESLILSAGYIFVALLFGTWIWHTLGSEQGINYMTGFFVEKSLSLDNIFVISLIFSYFAVPRIYQYRVLFWGIIGVIILRGLMIALGAALVSEFGWILYIFGGFLIVTGLKMMFVSGKEPDLADNMMLKFLKNHIPVTDKLHDERFTVTVQNPANGKARLMATPLLLALVMVECADIVFAVDSIPAIFAITTDPFIVYTSNIFAILGLRALYFALASMVNRFAYLKFALAAVLVFIGGKIFWNHFVGKIDPVFSLAVTLLLLAGGVVVSILNTRRLGVTPE
jgi:tellurite resistance protein TerC